MTSRESVNSAILEAITTGHWLEVNYRNKKGNDSCFWCEIRDIDVKHGILFVNQFNPVSQQYLADQPSHRVFLWLEAITSACILPSITCQSSPELLKKLDEEKGFVEEATVSSQSLLNYFTDCYMADHDYSYDAESLSLIPTLDADVLLSEEDYAIGAETRGALIEHVLSDDSKDGRRIIALNACSVREEGNNKIFVIAYYRVVLDLDTSTLRREKTPCLNYKFLKATDDQYDHYYLADYLVMSREDCEKELEKNPEGLWEEIEENCSKNERLDTSPYFFILKEALIVSIAPVMNAITEEKETGTLMPPLSSLFASPVMNDGINSRPLFFFDGRSNESQIEATRAAVNAPVSYIQGPPGTGKTATIHNILLSEYLADERVLVTSQNNKPLDDLYRLIKSPFPGLDFPVMRLGTDKYMTRALEVIARIMKRLPDDPFPEEEFMKTREALTSAFASVNASIDELLKKSEAKTSLDEIQSMERALKNDHGAFQSFLTQEEARLKASSSAAVSPVTLPMDAVTLLRKYLMLSSQKRFLTLRGDDYEELRRIVLLPGGSLASVQQKEKNRLFKEYLRSPDSLERFLAVFPIIITTNLSAYRLGTPEPVFNLVVMDEAAQCPVTPSLISIVQGKRLALFGDPLQLQPIIQLTERKNRLLKIKHHVTEDYDYLNNSILSLLSRVDPVSPHILLRNHYRCQKPIIEFSNQRYYHGALDTSTASSSCLDPLVFIPVKNRFVANETRNTSRAESEAIVSYLKTNERHYAKCSVGIITAFKNQSELIKEGLKNVGITNVDVGTIHSFQGAEKDVIIASTAITQRTYPRAYDWVKQNHQMMNVAITRARSQFVMVADYPALCHKSKSSSSDDLLALATYVKTKGKSIAVRPASDSPTAGPLMTRNEADMLTTLEQIMTTTPDIKVEHGVKGSKVFDRFALEPDDRKYLDACEFDFVIYDAMTALPLLVVELDGPEHVYSACSQGNDEKKLRLIREHNESVSKEQRLVILRIPNQEAYHYMKVKECIARFLGA